MAIIDNSRQIKKIEESLDELRNAIDDPMIWEPFVKDFSLRFCWSSNALEGNTLSLEETISVIEYDEVRSGHTYTEYQEAKNLYRAITQLLLPFQKRDITEEWIKETNRMIRAEKAGYRTGNVYIGTIAEAVYYPPRPEMIAEYMNRFISEIQDIENTKSSLEDQIEDAARFHIRFERIHPFQDGNGRTGRMILNQQLYNSGLIPLVIEPRGKYHQAFRQYDKNEDISLMVYTLCKGELASIKRIRDLVQRLQNN